VYWFLRSRRAIQLAQAGSPASRFSARWWAILKCEQTCITAGARLNKIYQGALLVAALSSVRVKRKPVHVQLHAEQIVQSRWIEGSAEIKIAQSVESLETMHAGVKRGRIRHTASVRSLG
jgi:hypothetical protein